jgi:hypothetical protein
MQGLASDTACSISVQAPLRAPTNCAKGSKSPEQVTDNEDIRNHSGNHAR